MEFKSVNEIFDSIDETRAKLVNAVSVLNESQADFRPNDEKWSATLIVEHLARTEGNLLRVIQKLLLKAEAENKTSDGSINPPVSLAELAQKAGAERFEAPAFIAPQGGTSLADSLRQLTESRAVLRALQPRIEAVDSSNTQFPHPFFGQLSLYQWLAFIGLHETRHLRQIQELLANKT